MASRQKSSFFDIGALQLFIVLALIGVLVGSRWFLAAPNMVTDGAIISLFGLGCLLRVKFSRLRRGVGSPEPIETDVGERDYRTAFALVCIGAILVLIGTALIEHSAP